MNTMAKTCRPMTFEEALEAGNTGHAKALFKEKEKLHIDAINRLQCETSELRGEINRLDFLVKTLTNIMMQDGEARRFRDMETNRTKGSGGTYGRGNDES